MTATRCPSKLDHRVSGAVLQCSRDRGHDALYAAADQLWADDSDDLIQSGAACCAGEWGYASPVDMHTGDCAEYLAGMDALEAQRRVERDVIVVAAPVGVRVTLVLTRRQADALLRAELSVGHGVRRSRDLVAAERRLMNAVRASLDPTAGTVPPPPTDCPDCTCCTREVCDRQRCAGGGCPCTSD